MTPSLQVWLNRRQVLGAAGAAVLAGILPSAARSAIAATPTVAATSGGTAAWESPPPYDDIIGVL